MIPDFITVILPTHAPALNRLERTLQALAKQTYPRDRWELLLVDNASPKPIPTSLAAIAHPEARVLRENQLGLSHARIAGIKAAAGAIIVFVDDDNLLQENYLTEAARFLAEHPEVAAVGGIIRAEFATTPPAWSTDSQWTLAIRNYGDAAVLSHYQKTAGQPEWPIFAPVGAGMVVRTLAARRFVEFFQRSNSVLSDRRGRSLGSAGDCELIMHAAFLAGQEIAYDPALELVHLIPAQRLKFKYLARLGFEGGITWGVFQVAYGLKSRIHPFSLLVRLPRAFFRRVGWTRRGFVMWTSVAGEFIGRAK